MRSIQRSSLLLSPTQPCDFPHFSHELSYTVVRFVVRGGEAARSTSNCTVVLSLNLGGPALAVVKNLAEEATLPLNTGKVGDFDDWHFKMKQSLESEAEFLPFMMWVDQQAAHVSEDDLAHYDQQEGLALNTEWLNQQRYRCAELEFGWACACSGKKFGGGSQDPRYQRMC